MTAPALQLDFGLDELAEVIRGKLFLTVPEVAELARVDQRTLRRAIEDGQLAAVRIGNATRIPTAALLQLAGLSPEVAQVRPTDSEAGDGTPGNSLRRDSSPNDRSYRHGSG